VPAFGVVEVFPSAAFRRLWSSRCEMRDWEPTLSQR
jgi:hypothetical protein